MNGVAAMVLLVAVGCSGAPLAGTSDPSTALPATARGGASGTPVEAPASSAPLRNRFEGRVSRIPPAMREVLIGRNWRPGCPVPLSDLRLVLVSYWNFAGDVRRGPFVVHERVADDVLGVFHRLFRARFPIHRIGLPPRYRPPRPRDWYNTRNLSSSFNCRPATGNTSSLSQHSYGWAIDLNPLQNPYVRSDGSVLRRAARPYRDRTLRRPGMIHDHDVVVRAFAAIGWEWGGRWHTLKDYMHFSLTGT